MKDWPSPTWAVPWGIDPGLFQDPISKKTHLNPMAPNNSVDRIWGIYQCQVNLNSEKCIGSYRSLWNSTLPHNSTARPEGPKMYYKDKYYNLLIAEGIVITSNTSSLRNRLIKQAARMTYTDHRSPVRHFQRVRERQLQTIHTSSMEPMVTTTLLCNQLATPPR
ncbi:glycoside hydrolase family 43 protein [Cenococcum geophilum 1.58]|uniref:glycoside hydrolase family 43 protein n=1 Tax=Cenococcum geophilum 1.58 TaxID=794803 RepID=UPI00358E60FF|nr:glycoside hydrolase family 43 protein [Cenococcum geophilum 1.58]